jgi:hypothetical protein
MSDEARRKILEAVAAGRMDPGEAANLLADLDASAGSAEPDPPSGDAAERVVERRVVITDDAPRRMRTVRVDANFRAVEIVGDAEVHEAVAEGSHRLRWEGDTLVIDGAIEFEDHDDFDDDDDQGSDFGEWFRTRGPRVRRTHIVGRGLAYQPRPLRVRMNPDVRLEARVEAGPLKIRRVHGPIKARVAAGPLVIEDFASPIDVRVAAGKVDAKGRIDAGESTIDCDAGTVRLHLTRGSHARVNASATLGKVDFAGRSGKTGRTRDLLDDLNLGDLGKLGNLSKGDFSDLSHIGEKISSMFSDAFSDEHEVVVGRGTGTVDVRVSMGAAHISFEDSE